MCSITTIKMPTREKRTQNIWNLNKINKRLMGKPCKKSLMNIHCICKRRKCLDQEMLFIKINEQIMKRLNLAGKIAKNSNHNSEKLTLIRNVCYEFHIFNILITFEIFLKINFSYVCGIVQVFVKYWISNGRLSCLFWIVFF